MAIDVIGREIKEEDYVFSHSYLYKVIKSGAQTSTSHGTVIGMIEPRSKTSKKKALYGNECCVIPKEEYLLWLLKKN